MLWWKAIKVKLLQLGQIHETVTLEAASPGPTGTHWSEAAAAYTPDSNKAH